MIQALQARGVAVYLISGGKRYCLAPARPAPAQTAPRTCTGETHTGHASTRAFPTLNRHTTPHPLPAGFRELCLPIARVLGVPSTQLFANRMNWQVDDDTGEQQQQAAAAGGACAWAASLCVPPRTRARTPPSPPGLPTRLVGFDPREPTGHQLGKPRAYETIVRAPLPFYLSCLLSCCLVVLPRLRPVLLATPSSHSLPRKPHARLSPSLPHASPRPSHPNRPPCTHTPLPR